MKLSQNVILEKISEEIENVSSLVVTGSLDKVLEKPCVRPRGYFFRPILMNLVSMFVLMIS